MTENNKQNQAPEKTRNAYRNNIRSKSEGHNGGEAPTNPYLNNKTSSIKRSKRKS